MGQAHLEERDKKSISDQDNQLLLFQQMIRKDLEITIMHHKMVSIFGEFALFSELDDELSSFEFMISLMTGEKVGRLGNGLLGKSASNCAENFLNMMIAEKVDLGPRQVCMLANYYTKYLSEIVSSYEKGDLYENYSHISQKYFQNELKH